MQALIYAVGKERAAQLLKRGRNSLRHYENREPGRRVRSETPSQGPLGGADGKGTDGEGDDPERDDPDAPPDDLT